MGQDEILTELFEQQRARLRSVAYRMLGSVSEAEDAIQDTWLRVNRADTGGVENMAAWLTTVLARVCLNMLRTRATRREQALDPFMPDPIIEREHSTDPEQQAVISDAVGIALLVVLETLTPAERLAFVLHDLFAVPFDQIAPMIERTPDAARQLASRARRRVRGQSPAPERDIARQRKVVDAFFAAAREGDFEALVAVLHPDVVFRATGLGPAPFVLSGAEAVAKNARLFGPSSPGFRNVLVNGGAGVIAFESGQLKSVTGFAVANGLIVAIDVLADPVRLSAIDLSSLEN